MNDKQRNRILIVLFIGVLMGALDIAIIGPALPAIRDQFGSVSERILTWIFTVYVLFNLIGTPLMAKLSDMFGRRKIYIIDILLFAAGSIIVAASPSFIFLLIGRAVQGFGAGGIFPVASAVIGDTFPKDKRGRALGLIGAVFGLAFIIGPVLGGLLLRFSWHWLFIINIPIALVVILLSLKVLPAGTKKTDVVFDWKGMVLLAVMLGSIAVALNQINTRDFFRSVLSWKVLPFLIGAAVLGFLLSIIEKRVKNPILKPSLFRSRQLRLAYILSAGAGIGEASLVFMPILAVAALGLKTRQASFLLLPTVAAMAIGSPTAGRLLDKFGSKRVILTGTVITAAGLFLLSRFAEGMALYIISGSLIGLGLSALLGAPVRYIMLNEAEESQRSVAQGIITIFASIGQLTGSALVGAVAYSFGGGTPGYSKAFFVIAILTAALLVAAILLKSHKKELQQ